ncbi:transposase, partial [Streptomyces chryseus]
PPTPGNDQHQLTQWGSFFTRRNRLTFQASPTRRWLWGKRIGVRIARKGVESSERLGRRRWVIERTMSWLTGYRRLNHRYEQYPGNNLAFLGLAAATCCYKRFRKLTM